ncbi:MAG TPA: thiamine pyrophosphate-binding protein [Thermomicrobiaceae bacterium]|nr:thiamine pyrophosphate-binding protein [Thermomicrobiaceae bacterium]
MRGADVIVEMLKAYGVDYVFGVPGDTTMPLYDALYQARGEINHVLARDERSASFMADAYARLTNRPGICEGPSGGGATYIVPGVAEANGSSIPVICFTSDNPLRWEHTGALTAIDQVALLKPATKWNTAVKQADRLPDLLRRAFREATSGRPGAVHLSLPEDVLEAEVDDPRIYAEAACTSFPSYRTRPSRSETETIYRALRAARRPMIVAGGGVTIAQGGEELVRLAALLEIPVGTTINGKGSMPEYSPWSVGVIGGNGGRPYANQLMREADTILYLGTKVNYLATLNGTIPAPGVTVLQIDVDPNELGNNVRLSAGAAADAREALRDLVALAESDAEQLLVREVSAAELEHRATDFWQGFQAKAADDSFPVKPQRIIAALEELLPERAVIVADPGTMTPFTAANFRVHQTGRSVVIPRAHGGLGYALPASVGAACARPGERIVALIGDGSFGMAGTELETVGRMNLPVTFIQFSNGSFGWIKMLQKLYFSDRYHNVDFTSTVDYARAATALGVPGVRVEHADQLGDAIAESLRADGPVFIDVPTESELEETPPVHAWQQALGLV